MVFSYKTNNKAIGLVAFGIWLLAVLSMAAIIVGQVGNFSQKNSSSSAKSLNIPSVKTLYVELNALPEMNDETNAKFDDFTVIKQNNNLVLSGHPELKIESTSADDFSIVVNKQARGKNSVDVQKNLNGIVYNFSSKDSTLYLDRFFTLENQAKWRKQEVAVTLKVPVGKQVYLGKDLENLNLNIDNLNNVWDKEMTGKTWKMTADGLSLKQ